MANLDGLLNRTYLVDSQYFGVNVLSVAASPGTLSTSFIPTLTSLTVQALDDSGPGGTRGIGEQLKILAVNDTFNTVTFGFLLPTGSIAGQITDTVLGYDPSTNSILIDGAFNAQQVAVQSGGVSGLNAVTGIISSAPISPQTTLTYPALTATTVVGIGSAASGGASSATGSGASGTSSSGTSSGTATVPVYRFFDSLHGTQFLTSSQSEHDTVVATRPDLVSEGVGLEAASSSDPNASPIYRFFDSVFGTHFYTASSTERDAIKATRSDLVFEGVGFNEYSTAQTGTTPVYRFFESTNGTHFFTSSASERNTILATRPDLVAEGISFYAPT